MEKAWWSIGLSCCNRDTDSTYRKFSYEELPPIQAKLDENFKWLERKPRYEYSMSDETFDVKKLFQIEAQINTKLPKFFSTFVKNKELSYRITSCTACYFTLPNYVVKTVGKYEGFLILFLSDQQGCIKWYLYLDKTGEHFIVSSANYYGFDSYDELSDEGLSNFSYKSEIDLEEEEVWFCGNSFKEFIYRFWIENELWRGGRTKEQKHYIAHYLNLNPLSNS